MESIILKDRLVALSRPSRRTSIQTLQKVISIDYSQDLQCKSPTFIPFFKERDGLNKLILYQYNEESPKSREVQTAIPMLVSPKRRLLKKTQPVFPSVGTYNIHDSWSKKTFSVRSFKSTPNLEVITSPSNLQTTTNGYFKPCKIQKQKYRLENAIDRKAKRINVQRQLGIWECLKIYGTPEEIKEELKFTKQKADTKKLCSEIKTLVNDLKR
ncbi:hypothetical protein SteCoe_27988 [Stentor coeruleus]|uniref:Uncharacterized protein n=1 Tax=Stentor coeruleus TaxID=5963 RepID=A0A1R2B965_9CILI|nr:hypothetical protein SteCoe_27988 [Stentor coeruleus]